MGFIIYVTEGVMLCTEEKYGTVRSSHSFQYLNHFGNVISEL
jgi:hypothetical protein